MQTTEKRVLVGMSGGIDSSAVCLMLQEQGYEVIGVTLRTWDVSSHFSTPGQVEPDEVLEARSLARRLGIEHHVADVREEFRQVIVRYFIEEYMRGRTPNPCVLCNPLFKERVLCEWADRTGCACIATGHYCRLVDKDGYRYIVTGDDSTKDQSYFLWKLPQTILRRMIFPLGGMTKADVRTYLAEKGFEAKARGGESMEICFIDKDYREFLKELFHRQGLPGIPEGTLSGHRRTDRPGLVCRQQRIEARSAQRFCLLHHRTTQRTGDSTRETCLCIENQSSQEYRHARRCRTIESRIHAAGGYLPCKQRRTARLRQFVGPYPLPQPSHHAGTIGRIL